ncbi:MAG: hypothetical protein LUD39_05555 [Opitutae bacterium]|nr:hypothetical protein [Opitutae bacterium]MCD8299205.1 hypothetical protein [Opitutae bacterium]
MKKGERGAQFATRWLEKFGLKKFTEAGVREHLATLPLPDTRDFELVEFLFLSLPKLFARGKTETFAVCAEAYARFCFAFWQCKNAFIPYPQDYAQLLKSALCGEKSLLDSGIAAIAELAGAPSENDNFGFNTFSFKDSETIRKSVALACRGDYEDFLTESGKKKFSEFELALRSSAEFKRDWEMLKALYPNYITAAKRSVLHRRATPERGWSRGLGTLFDSDEQIFFAAFDLLCWKYYLWGMDTDTDEPLLLKPSVNTTPYGTQIFVPAYMSFDAARDFDWKKVAELHRAKGVRRQGRAFSESRIENAQLAKRAKFFEEAGKAQGFRGEALTDFIARKLRLPNADSRSIRRLLGR